jgi:hypothetical protein
VLRKVFGAAIDKVTKNWRKLHNKELHNLYFAPPSIIQVTRSRKMGWTGHVAHSVGRGMHTGFRRGNLKE